MTPLPPTPPCPCQVAALESKVEMLEAASVKDKDKALMPPPRPPAQTGCSCSLMRC